MAKIVAFLALLSASLAIASSARVVCYVAGWTVYRPGQGLFTVDNVDPNLCTHILYAFVGLNEDGSVRVLDDWEAFGSRWNQIPKVIALKQKNPKLKVLISMGGWNEGSLKYSQVAADAGKRANMVKSVLSFVNQHGFDGFDLDWEYPAQRGGNEKIDQNNFVILLGQLKRALNAQGKILAAAVAGGIASTKISYPNIKAVADNLDMISLMVYDFHGAFENYVGHHAPLYASPADFNATLRELNVASGVQFWLNQGAPASKLNMGIGTYGRGFTLANANNNKLYAPVIGGSRAGPFTRQDGIIGYNEVCSLLKSYQYIWDNNQLVPHKIQGNQWIGYEDVRSVTEKTKYAKSKKLGGVMVWSLDTDDFGGYCGQGKYPLLNAINKNL